MEKSDVILYAIIFSTVLGVALSEDLFSKITGAVVDDEGHEDDPWCGDGHCEHDETQSNMSRRLWIR